MKQIHVVVSSITACAALAVWGCGGGGGAATGGSTDALRSAQSALTGMASGSQATTTQSLTNALTLFEQAVKANPSDPVARFGEAIAMAGYCTDLMDGGTISVTPNAAGGGSGSGSGSGGGLPGTGISVPPMMKSPKLLTTRDTGIVVGPNIPAPPSTGVMPPVPPTMNGTPGNVPPDNELGLIWFLDRGLANPYTLMQVLAPVTDLHLGLMPFSGYSSDASDVTRRQTLLADLGTVLSDLAVVEADPNFTYTLPSPDQNGQSVTIGLPEVYLFDAFINSLQAEVALSLAYIRDPGSYQPISPIVNAGSGGATGTTVLPPAPPVFASASAGPITSINYQSLDANHDGNLEPNEYLPPSPFLTLRSATYLATAQNSLKAIAAKETLGINGVLARSSGGSYLIPNTPDIAAVLTNINTNVVPLIGQSAIGPVTLSFPQYNVIDLVGAVAEGSDGAGGVFQSVPVATVTVDTPPSPPAVGGVGISTGGNSGSGGSVPTVPPGISVTQNKVTIDLAAWFSNPPQDLKVFAPIYTLTAQGGIDPTGTTYPDPTFGGLFPNGLPAHLLL